jgi:ABC-type bacteriocin/lantibiotic exporter with double-glycine peptidase domain
MGDIGSGKSTLLKLLLKLHHCTQGTIAVDGVPLHRCTPTAIRERIGHIQQQPRLFNRSIYDNIVYEMDTTKWTPSRVQHKINDLQVNGLFTNLPEGLQTKVGKNGSQISGGQRQAIMLLRMALSDKPILTLDEPTSALDANNKKLVLSMIRKISRNKTCFIVTHDDDVRQSVDRVIVFKRGSVLKDYDIPEHKNKNSNLS